MPSATIVIKVVAAIAAMFFYQSQQTMTKTMHVLFRELAQLRHELDMDIDAVKGIRILLCP